MSAIEVPNPVIQGMFARREVLDSEGGHVTLRANVLPQHANALYREVLRVRPQKVLEIGMAYGVTSLAILTALAEIGEDGSLTTVDPHQSRQWDGIGVLNVERAGLSDRFRLIEEFDYLALPRLLDEGKRFDFAYIDGCHNFEYALLDFFYTDKLLNLGGIVGFNDCDWLPVRAVLRFVEGHRHYERVDVGLEAAYANSTDFAYGDRADWSRYLRRLDLRLTRGRVTRAKPVSALLGRRREDQYFRKLGERETPWGYWAPL